MIRDVHTTTGLEARAAKKAEAPRPESKGDRQAKLKSVNMTSPPGPTPTNPSPFPRPDAPPPEPKTEPKTEVKEEVKTEAPKRGRKKAEGETPADRESVKKWKAQGAFKDEQIIHIVSKENPKRRAAGERFADYRDGMTVKEYISVMEKKGRKRGATMGDIRWDHAQGFIRVE